MPTAISGVHRPIMRIGTRRGLEYRRALSHEMQQRLGQEHAFEQAHHAKDQQAEPDRHPTEARGLVRLTGAERLTDERRSRGAESQASGERELEDANDHHRRGAVDCLSAAAGASRVQHRHGVRNAV